MTAAGEVAAGEVVAGAVVAKAAGGELGDVGEDEPPHALTPDAMPMTATEAASLAARAGGLKDVITPTIISACLGLRRAAARIAGVFPLARRARLPAHALVCCS